MTTLIDWVVGGVGVQRLHAHASMLGTFFVYGLYGYYIIFFVQVWQFARKLHLIGNFHKLAQIYFIVFLKTPPTYKDVDPPLAPPPGLNNKRVL